MTMMTKSYSEMIKLPTFEERFQYLKLDGFVGDATFGFNRYLNQIFYKSPEWRRLRHDIIVRDNACDLAVEGREIQYHGGILIHHINPITLDDIDKRSYILFDPDNLVVVTQRTHNAIHYGDESVLIKDYVERRPNDTCPWRK